METLGFVDDKNQIKTNTIILISFLHLAAHFYKIYH
jgi:hypothetical protein